MVQECLSEEERKAFQGAMKGHLMCVQQPRVAPVELPPALHTHMVPYNV